VDVECKPTLSSHPLQGAENWLRDPFAISGISLNVSSCWYHYPQLRSLCLVHTLITEAIAPVSSFINGKIPSFWLLAIVRTRFKNASCRRYSTSVGLLKTVPYGVKLSWPFAKAFAHFPLFPKNVSTQ